MPFKEQTTSEPSFRTVSSNTYRGRDGRCKSILPVPNRHPRFKCCKKNTKWLLACIEVSKFNQLSITEKREDQLYSF